MIRLMVGIPAYRRHVDVGHVYQMMQLASECSRGAIRLQGFVEVDSCFVCKARNKITKYAMEQGAHWLLTCDHDTFNLDPFPVIHMIAEGQATGAAVIAAPYKRRHSESTYNVVSEGRYLESPEFQGRILEVDRMGTGFMAINLAWLHEHWPQQPWFKTETLEGEEPAMRGEDFWFCDGVRQRGGTILCDGRFEPVHMTRI